MDQVITRWLEARARTLGGDLNFATAFRQAEHDLRAAFAEGWPPEKEELMLLAFRLFRNTLIKHSGQPIPPNSSYPITFMI